MIEYTIKIKDEKSSLSEKFISYDPLLLDSANIEIMEKVKVLFQKFKNQEESAECEAPEVTIRANMVIQS
jgi:uncharacterized protein YabN with tetrapyrrole methylase and pyrophosphatase domain